MAYLAQGVDDNVEVIVRRAAAAALNTAVMTTPIDTGRARGNWLVSIGKPDIREVEVEGEAAGPAAIASGQETIATWRIGASSIFLANSLEYIPYLDDGWSAQAPQGMTKAAVTAARRQLGRHKLLKIGGKLNRSGD